MTHNECTSCGKHLVLGLLGYCADCSAAMIRHGKRLHWLANHAHRATKTPDGWRIYWRQRGIVRQAEADTLVEAVDLAMQEQDEIEDAEGIGGGV